MHDHDMLAEEGESGELLSQDEADTFEGMSAQGPLDKDGNVTLKRRGE
jgi:hypothetical protein